MKVRYIKETNPSLTKGRKYKVISECERYYLIKDNDGDEEKKRKERFEVVETNNDRDAGRKKIENGVIIRVTVPKELIKDFKQLVKNWRVELQTKNS